MTDLINLTESECSKRQFRKLLDLHEKVREGILPGNLPILCLNEQADGWSGNLFATYAGQSLIRPKVKDERRILSVLADCSSLIQNVEYDKSSNGVTLDLDVRSNASAIKDFFRQNFPNYKFRFCVHLISPEQTVKPLVFIPDKVYLGKQEFLAGFEKLLKDSRYVTYTN